MRIKNSSPRHILIWKVSSFPMLKYNLAPTNVFFSQLFPPHNHAQLQPTVSCQIKNGNRRRSNITFCTQFGKDFDFWFRYDVSIFSPFGLDIGRNFLLVLRNLTTQLELFLSRTWLTSFGKNYDKMKHVTYSLFWNTNTVSTLFIFQTKFNRRIREKTQFLFQHGGLDLCLADWSCWKMRRRVLLVLLFVNRNPVISQWTHI